MEPQQLARLIGNGFVTMAAGDSHTVALKTDGSLWTWGGNKVGQLGDGSTNSSLIPKQIGEGYASIAAAKNATLALRKDGSLWEWGVAPGLGSSLIPVQMGHGFVRFVVGKNHVLALKPDGSLWVWGSNAMGQFGDSTNNDSNIPILVGQGFVDVAAGDFHSAALKADGSLWAWGSNSLGQLGDAATTQSNYPKFIDTDFTTVAVGGGAIQYVSGTHIAALKRDGSLWAWGSNIRGQLGDGTVIPSSIPKQIGQGYSAVAAGLFFTIALKTNGDLWGWGTNVYGQLGNPVTNTAFLPPTFIGTGYKSITVGGDGGGFTLAIKTDGTLWAWGFNASGQLGDGTTTDRSQPTLIGSGFRTVTAGNSHTVAIKTDGTLWVWGDNSSGQFGDGTSTRSLIPKQVGEGYIAVAAGLQFTTAIKQDGTLWAWGRNEYGQLGDGSIVNSSFPKLIGNGFRSVSANQSNMQAVKSDGTVWATGNNFFGQLGDGTLASKQSLSPVVNDAVDSTLDLIPEIANEPVANFDEPPFLVKTEELAKMNVEIQYDNTAHNKDGSVYVTAYLPTNSPVLTGKTVSATSSAELIPAVLTQSGWKQANADDITEAFYTGSLNSAKTIVDLFNSSQFDRKNSAGVFCVGYSAGQGTKSAKGLMRAVVTGGQTTAKCPLLKVDRSLMVNTLNLGVGWNLVGNGIEAAIDVTTILGDATQVNTVWKWVVSSTTSVGNPAWAFYAPSLADGGKVYAASKGYDALTTIQAGEGFWVNAKAGFALTLPAGAAVTSTSFAPNTGTHALAKGWNLIATGDKPTPLAFHQATGSLPINFTTLWAWDAVKKGWYFWAPSLANDGGLADYLTKKEYLDFTTLSNVSQGTLSPTTGCWVNKP